MKNTLSLLILVPLLFACSPKEKQGIKLTGMVENLGENQIVLGGPGGSRDTILLDESGNFLFENQDLDESALHYLFIGDEFIYMHLAPGMELDLYADMANFSESTGFSGQGSDINNYMLSKDPRAFDYNWYALEEDEFRFKVDSLLAVQQAELNLAEKEDIEDPFWKMEEGDVLFGWAGYLERYPSYHGYYAEIEDFEVGDDFYLFREELDVNNPEYANSQAFNSYLSTRIQNVVNEKIATIMEEDSTAEVDRGMMSLQYAAEMIEQEEVLNNYLLSTLTNAMQWNELGELTDQINFFREQVTDEEVLAEFEEEYQAWDRLSAGQPMFDFIGKDLEGNPVSSEDFRGKYLYVDVWATWCGPCIAEIPHLKKLEADYHDRNIVFLSYSIDEDHQAWLDYVPENELGGVQIIGENAWESQLCQDYKIMGVPTFMFFDPEGKIISVKMTRPSNEETRERFDSYSDL